MERIRGNENMYRNCSGKTGKRGIKRELGRGKCGVGKRIRRLDEREG